MPTLYLFPLADAGAAGNASRVAPSVQRYAFTPATSADGDVRIEGADLARGVPELETVRSVLLTPLGSYAPDPLFGVDYTVVQKATRDVAAKWKAAVAAGLKFLVDAKRITDLAIEVDPPANGRLLFEVSFRDPVSALVDGLGGRMTF
jgi:hypothetical protein